MGRMTALRRLHLNSLPKGFNPVVHHITQVYEKGITVDALALAPYRVDWHPSPTLAKWAITIG